ncbi:MAG: hypothetical protein GY756_15410 [bacterium]|nr:hypothetical protein [bacterium]
MKTTNKILVFAICLLAFSCSNNSDKSKIDYSTLELTVERGAFHYDKFALKDTIITFYPSKDSLGDKYHNYTKMSKQVIGKATRDSIIDRVLDEKIWDMDSIYYNNTSCNSHLTVIIKLGNKTKKIICSDFKRGCPKLLQYIENEIVKLHNKGLKRVVLPG